MLRTVLTTLITLVAFSLPSASAFASERCEISRWGADDEIGAANLITPETALKAAQLVTTGRTYGLGIIIDSN